MVKVKGAHSEIGMLWYDIYLVVKPVSFFRLPFTSHFANFFVQWNLVVESEGCTPFILLFEVKLSFSSHHVLSVCLSIFAPSIPLTTFPLPPRSHQLLVSSSIAHSHLQFFDGKLKDAHLYIPVYFVSEGDE